MTKLQTLIDRLTARYTLKIEMIESYLTSKYSLKVKSSSVEFFKESCTFRADLILYPVREQENADLPRERGYEAVFEDLSGLAQEIFSVATLNKILAVHVGGALPMDADCHMTLEVWIRPWTLTIDEYRGSMWRKQNLWDRAMNNPLSDKDLEKSADDYCAFLLGVE
jgi:hypothetical protein